MEVNSHMRKGESDMSFIDIIVQVPLLEKLLPARHRPVNDELLQDTHTKTLLQSTEQLLDEIIEKSPTSLRYRKTFTNNSTEYAIRVKISKKKINLVLADTHRSSAPLKKKITIECYRKYMKEKNGLGKCIKSTISYKENERTIIRSVRKSPYFQAIFYKIDLLDDTLLSKLIDQNRSFQNKLLTQKPALLNKGEDGHVEVAMDLQRFLQHQKYHLVLDSLLESRLHSLLSQTKVLIPELHLLELEDRHMIKRMIRNDLPQLVHAYVALSPKDKELHKEDVFLTLSKMELKIIHITKKLNDSRVKRMEHLLKLNEMRYKR